ncbi:MAG: DUF1232 domain-containing protein [Bacteroidales bacterium]|nr:DUF1232 domain-containing protein [Bacteroidales bacterium]
MLKRIEPENIEKYGKHYDEAGLWKKIGAVAKRAGSKVIYPVLLLYYVLQDKNTPLKHKAVIVGALGYFILPLDLIPDLVPLLGFSDDLAALVACVKAIIDNVTPEIKEKANRKLETWF